MAACRDPKCTRVRCLHLRLQATEQALQQIHGIAGANGFGLYGQHPLVESETHEDELPPVVALVPQPKSWIWWGTCVDCPRGHPPRTAHPWQCINRDRYDHRLTR